MRKEDSTNEPGKVLAKSLPSRRHPITLENSPEETIERIRLLSERATSLRELLRARQTGDSH
jgi:hypothetical protein